MDRGMRNDQNLEWQSPGSIHQQQHVHGGTPPLPVYELPPTPSFMPYYPMMAQVPFWEMTYEQSAYIARKQLLYQMQLHQYLAAKQAVAAAAAAANAARAAAEVPLARFNPPAMEVMEEKFVAVPGSSRSSGENVTNRRVFNGFAGQQIPLGSEQPPLEAVGATPPPFCAWPESSRSETPLRDWSQVDFTTSNIYLPDILMWHPPPFLYVRRPWTIPVEDLDYNPAASTHPSFVHSPPATPASPAPSGSPDVVSVTPPVRSVVSPMPLPLCLKRTIDPNVTHFSEPSNLRSSQLRKQRSFRSSLVSRSINPYTQNSPIHHRVSTPYNYRTPPPAHSHAPLWSPPSVPVPAYTAVPYRAHSPLSVFSTGPPPAHSSMPPPARSPMPFWMQPQNLLRTDSSTKYIPVSKRSPVHHQPHSPNQTRSPKFLRTESPMRVPEVSFVSLPAHSPVLPPANSPISFLNISLPPPLFTPPHAAPRTLRPRTPTPVHPRTSAAKRPPSPSLSSVAPTHMWPAAFTPMGSAAPEFHSSAFKLYSTAPSPAPVPSVTMAPARHLSAYVEQESQLQYVSSHRGMQGHIPESMRQAPMERLAVNYPRMNRLLVTATKTATKNKQKDSIDKRLKECVSIIVSYILLQT